MYISIQPENKLSYLGKRSGPRENARARGPTPRGFAARSRVLARLASLAQIGELAGRLISINSCQYQFKFVKLLFVEYFFTYDQKEKN